MNKIIVTGGAGYIGSHTCKLLRQKGYDPITIDNLSTGHSSFVKWGELIKLDIKETDKLMELLKKINPIAIIHFAASSDVGESMVNPTKYYQNNVAGTISLLEAMQSNGLQNIVFSSSCAIYGIPSSDKIKEDSILNPISPYGNSKLIIEKILIDLSKLKKINFYSLRYFNAAGADDDLEIGELHDPETHLIPLAIKSGFNKDYILKIFGSDFNTPDGTAIRDYIHVNDLAEAHYLSLENLLNEKKSDFINLGNGVGFSVMEIIDILRKQGIKIKYETHNKRDGDPPKLLADNTKAAEVLNWAPSYDIEKTLFSAHSWYKKINSI